MNFSFFDTMRRGLFCCFVLVTVLSSCIKAPTYPVIPHIEFKEVSSSIVRAGAIDTITFSFTDGDGDIGTFTSNSDTSDLCGLERGDSTALHSTSYNIFLIDNRDSCISPFASANIQSTSKNKGIKGEMVVITPIYSKHCFATPNPNCPVDTAIFSIMLKDMAGHQSNIIQSTPIVCDPRY